MTATIEAEFLEGIALDGAPPCELIFTRPARHQCKNPSVVRVRTFCPCSPAAPVIFLCQRCYDMLRDPTWRDRKAHGRQALQCTGCYSTDFTWTST